MDLNLIFSTFLIFILKEACHHVSIAWCVGDKKEELEKIAAGLKLEIEQTACNMAEVRCKIGNLVKRL
jgi:hypothetical protein